MQQGLEPDITLSSGLAYLFTLLVVEVLSRLFFKRSLAVT